MPMFCLIFMMPTQRSFEALKMPIQFVANGPSEALGGGARGLANQRDACQRPRLRIAPQGGVVWRAQKKPRPMGIKGRGQSGTQRLASAPYRTTYHQIAWNSAGRVI
jgi:hypothetical protein